MSKRKAGVKDIIYELDNDDIEISSEDEGKHPKINRLESDNGSQTSNDDVIIQETPIECINLDCSIDTIDIETSSLKAHNGGKSPNVIQIEDDDQPPIKEADSSQKLSTNVTEASILNEDIVVDSPASNTDLGVAGCENRTPLFTVRFKDKKVAKAYKEEIKAFMLKLIKLHDDGALDGSETETDLELDIWPEDLQEPVSVVETQSQEEPEDNFFFVDTDPSVQELDEIPRYRQANTLISNIVAEETTPPPVLRRGPTCFNCDGAHPLRDCQLPRDNARIADKRKNMVKVGRYHVEDEQKYGHLIPGRISGNLRHALGLKRAEIPLYIYRMRMLGYPPGWLEEARISHSGITMFDSTGSAIRDPEEEEGELSEPGSKDKFDIKKILDFPGFNVPASSRYREEAHLYGLPPLSEQDSKIAMLQMLAPNAMKAYKRKKLTFFPSADKAQADGQAEMELDSGDEVAEFPSVPPLPDDAPPPPPPPPASPPPLPASQPPPPTSQPSPPASKPPPPTSRPSPPASLPPPPVSQPSPPASQPSPPTPQPSPPTSQPSPPASQPSPPASQPPPPASQPPPPTSPQPPKSPSPPPKSLPPSPNQPADAQPTEEGEVESMNETEDELEIVAVTEVQDIPMPADASHITIEDDTDLDKSELSSGRGSPSLDDLEEKKRLLLNALETDVTLPNSPAISLDIDPSGKDLSDSTKIAENENMDTAEPKNGIMDAVEDENENMDTTETNSEMKETLSDDGSKMPLTVDVDINASPLRSIESPSISREAVKTPTADTKGLVKTTSYGTPVMNIASPYLKLPSDDKFAKDICDVINFENLPNSTGKYKKICNLLKKVKNEVDRIHDS